MLLKHDKYACLVSESLTRLRGLCLMQKSIFWGIQPVAPATLKGGKSC